MNQTVKNYLDVLDGLQPEELDRLRELCTPDVHFRDPFNNVRSVDAYIEILKESFETMSDVSFEVLETFWSDEAAVVKWNFHFRMKEGREREMITGLSEVRANAEGRITAHLDYWDSGERIYARIPVIGVFIRMIRRKVSAGLDESATARPS